MHYSRHDFLKAAVAVLPLLGMPWFYTRPARAGAARGGAYGQERAARIHRQAMEEAMAKSGKRPKDTLRPSR
jgi:hypothetical protein